MKIKKFVLLMMAMFFCVGILFAQGKAVGGRKATGYISYEDCRKEKTKDTCKAFFDSKKEHRGGLGAFASSDILNPKKYPKLYRRYKNNLFVIGGFLLFFIIIAFWVYRKTTKTPL
jgi:cbb3-type cytochrome oxidase subunit 3